MSEKKLTGWHVFFITASAFSIIIGVNLVLATKAVQTFPGLETKNSYVASQTFDDERAAQLDLAWRVAAKAQDGELRLFINDQDNNPIEVSDLQAVLGRATHVAEDIEPEFTFDGTSYVANVDIEPGNWNLRIVAMADNGTQFRQRVIVEVAK